MAPEADRAGTSQGVGPGGEGASPGNGGGLKAILQALRRMSARAGSLTRSLLDVVRRDLGDAFARRRRFRHLGVIAAVAGLSVYLLSGVYLVSPGETGVVSRFGRVLAERASPGLRWHIPWPVERVRRVNVSQIRREGIGVSLAGHPVSVHPAETIRMLSGDENLLTAKAIVQYRVSQPADFLYQVDYNEDPLLRAVIKAALTEVASRMHVDSLLTTGRTELQQRTRKLAQVMLDSYRSGLEIVSIDLQEIAPPDEVATAFRDVASAAEEKNKLINDAQGYANSLIPQARGEAEKRLREAEGYIAEVANRARGEAQRYLDALTQYRRESLVDGARVTRDRLYLETMEKVLPKARKYVFETGRGGEVNLRFFEQTPSSPPPRQ